MELAYIDKFVKVTNDLKYQLVRQDLFDRTVDAKGIETKDFKKQFVVCALSAITAKTIDHYVFGSTKEQNMLESVKNFAKLKEYSFISQRIRLRLPLLSVQCDPWKKFFTVTWKVLDTITLICLSQFVTNLNPEKSCSKDLIPKNVRNSQLFFIQQATTRI